MCRQRSGWSNADLTAAIVRRLAAALEPYAWKFQIVLFLDALRAHVSTVVLDAMSETRILPLIIPAGLTDTLQPLDTHVFSTLKNKLRENVEQARCSAASSDVTMPRFIGCVRDALGEIFLGRDWSHAFVHNGFELNQNQVSAELEASVQTVVGDARVGHMAPTLSQIELCLPRGAGVAAAIMWRRFLQTPHQQAVEVFGRVGNAVASVPNEHAQTIFGRTRSQTRALRTKAVV